MRKDRKRDRFWDKGTRPVVLLVEVGGLSRKETLTREMDQDPEDEYLCFDEYNDDFLTLSIVKNSKLPLE